MPFLAHNTPSWARPYPWVIDACDALLRPVQHQEGCQVGSIGGHNDHGKASPHHAQDACREASRGTCGHRSGLDPWACWQRGQAGYSLTFPNARVEQDTPREPHGRGQRQCILLLFLTVHFEPAKGAAGHKGRVGERAGERAGQATSLPLPNSTYPDLACPAPA